MINYTKNQKQKPMLGGRPADENKPKLAQKAIENLPISKVEPKVADDTYTKGRMTASGKVPDDGKKPAGESEGKYNMRVKTQEEGGRMYTYNGKTEYAGEQKDMNKLTPRGSAKSVDPKPVLDIPTKVKIEKEPVKVSIKRKEVSGKPSYKEQDRAPGLGGANKLQRVN